MSWGSPRYSPVCVCVFISCGIYIFIIIIICIRVCVHVMCLRVWRVGLLRLIWQTSILICRPTLSGAFGGRFNAVASRKINQDLEKTTVEWKILRSLLF